MGKRGGYSSNDMRSMAKNPTSSHFRAAAENHRVQTSGYTPNDMRSIVKNPNSEAYQKDQENTEKQKTNKD
jgi:ubiquitin